MEYYPAKKNIALKWFNAVLTEFIYDIVAVGILFFYFVRRCLKPSLARWPRSYRIARASDVWEHNLFENNDKIRETAIQDIGWTLSDVSSGLCGANSPDKALYL